MWWPGNEAGPVEVKGADGKLVEGEAGMGVWRRRFEEAGVAEVEGVGSVGVRAPYEARDGPPNAVEVGAAVSALKMGKAAGPDGVATAMLRKGGLVWWLVKLFDGVWTAGKVPCEWKRALLVPVYKKGDVNDPANYRGISLMVVAAKVLERVVLNRIRGDREVRSREEQAGFRAGRSCGEQVFALRLMLQERAEWGLPVAVVALDFKAAYDSVDRGSLWRVLEAEGMGPSTLAVLRSLGEKTEAAVRVGGKVGEWFPVERGVRQGSVVSPVLFGAVMDWLMRRAISEVEGVGVVLGGGPRLADLDYADDVLGVAESVEALQRLVDAVDRVGRRIGMELNPKKVEWMANKLVPAGVLKVCGVDLERKSSLVYLGSLVDAEGGCAAEVARRVAVASASFGRLRGLWRSREVSLEVKVAVYRAVVRGVMLYGSETWASRAADVSRLSVFERRCAREMMGVSWRDRVSNVALCTRTGLGDVGSELVTRRWRWLGHVLRMGEMRIPRRWLLQEGLSMGGVRKQGEARLTWMRCVMREGWNGVPWKELKVRKPLWKRWCDGGWRPFMLDLAGDRDSWRSVVDAVARQFSSSARPSRVG